MPSDNYFCNDPQSKDMEINDRLDLVYKNEMFLSKWNNFDKIRAESLERAIITFKYFIFEARFLDPRKTYKYGKMLTNEFEYYLYNIRLDIYEEWNKSMYYLTTYNDKWDTLEKQLNNYESKAEEEILGVIPVIKKEVPGMPLKWKGIEVNTATELPHLLNIKAHNAYENAAFRLY